MAPRLRWTLLLAVGLVAGCGGGGAKLAAGQIAVVCGEPVTSAQFDALLRQSKAAYKVQKQPFPAAGTPQYGTIKQHMIDLLVAHAEQRAAARKLGIHVTDARVAASMQQLLASQFHGSRNAFERFAKQQGMTDHDVRDLLASNLLQSAIAERLVSKLTVTDADVRAYYAAHQAQYRTHRTRTVREILVKTRAQAIALAGQARAGGDFATLARSSSLDPAAKRTGGATTVEEGTLALADQAAVFSLPVGHVSEPFRIGVTWAIVQPTAPVTKAKVIPLAQVRLPIEQFLLGQKREAAVRARMSRVKKDCADDARYAEGFRPTG